MSAYVTIAGKDVIKARLALPLDGAWHADVAVDSQTVLSGKVTITIADQKFTGTIRRGGEALDVGLYRIVGGGGGMNQDATPTSYRQTPLRIPINDLLKISGDELADSADSTMLGNTLKNWVTVKQPIGTALTRLVKSQGDTATWRTLANGKIWLGVDSWPVIKLAYDLLYNDTRNGMKLIDVDTPTLIPGVVLDGERINYVQYEYSEKGGRTSIWTEASA